MVVARTFQDVRELRRRTRDSNFARYLKKNSEVYARYTKGIFHVSRKYGVSRASQALKTGDAYQAEYRYLVPGTVTQYTGFTATCKVICRYVYLQ